MRIVAGSARGRRLTVPDGNTTRPTTDRVREATFNALFSLDAIEDATFCDLFGGSGALGLEALSRGAAHCTFVERDRAALRALNANIESLGFEDQCTVVNSDSIRWIAHAGHFDVVLADPPYDFDAWGPLLASIDTGLLVVESDRPLEQMLRESATPESPETESESEPASEAATQAIDATIDAAVNEALSGWTTIRERTYGSTVVALLQPRSPQEAP